MNRDAQVIELANHLRAVHFALVIVCVSLIAAVFIDTSEDLQRAATDLENIIRARSRWVQRDWLEDYATRVASSYARGKKILPIMIEVSDFHPKVVAVHAERQVWWYLDMPGPPPEVLDHLLDPDGGQRFTFDSLRNFKLLWDSLYRTRSLTVPTAIIDSMLVGGDSEWERKEWLESDETKSEAEIRLKELICDARTQTVMRSHLRATERDIPCAFVGSLTKAAKSLPSGVEPSDTGTSGPRLTVVFRARTVLFPVSLSELGQARIEPQRELIDHLRSKGMMIDWQTGLFANSFSELEEITRNYQELSLRNIEVILQSERKRSTESLEVLGVKFPVKALRLGILLILAVQIYLYVHLRAFGERIATDSEAWDVAWVVLYNGRWATGLSFLSLFVLPAVVAIVFLVDYLGSTRDFLSRWLVFHLLALSFTVWLAIRSRGIVGNLRKVRFRETGTPEISAKT